MFPRLVFVHLLVIVINVIHSKVMWSHRSIVIKLIYSSRQDIFIPK